MNSSVYACFGIFIISAFQSNVILRHPWKTKFRGNLNAAYASMKGAIEVLTKYLAKELGPRSIAVNVVAPGAIETDFGGGAVRDNAQINAFIASQTALGRVGLPDDIGGVIASLLSEDNRWINAQRIEASGGMFL
ncbi:MAG: SDR family oxidoreductase [Candidatus Competibacter sp.]